MTPEDKRIRELVDSVRSQIKELYELVKPNEDEQKSVWESDYGLDDDAEVLNEAMLVLQYRDMVKEREEA